MNKTNYKPDITSPEEVLKIEKLVKTYKSPDGSIQTILNIDLISILKGESYCIKGNSGSGKTTLLNIIAGILLPDSGSICIAGTEITKLTELQRDLFRAQNIGYIFQNFNLLQGFTALENVLFAMQFKGKIDSGSKKYAIELLKQTGLIDYIDYKPCQLSFGQQQRVAVARALANNPEIILADEPTGSLDKNNAREIIKLIKDLAKENNSTLLLATHSTEIMDGFSNIIEL